MYQLAKRIVSFLLFCVVSLPCVAWGIARGLLGKYDLILVCDDGGFGHTITLPDVARRLYPGKKILLFFYFRKFYHNYAVTDLWQANNLCLYFVPITFGLKLRKNILFYNSVNVLILNKLIQYFFPRVKTIHQVYADVPLNQEQAALAYKNGISQKSFALTNPWVMKYFELMRLPGVGGLKLSAQKKQLIERCAGLQENTKKCGFYLRQKGHDDKSDASNRNRSGSDFFSYAEAIHFLISKGYTILLKTDLDPPQNFLNQFGQHVVLRSSFGKHADLFDIYLASESDLFIGEAGGGSWLPVINSIPSLILNGFPFWFGLEQAMICFKNVSRSDGGAVNLSNFLQKDCFEFDQSIYSLKELSGKQITDAVEYFWRSHFDTNFVEPKYISEMTKLFPTYTWFAQSQSRLCVGSFSDNK